MKKFLSVLLVLGLLSSIGFTNTNQTKIPKRSSSQNFVLLIASYLHYELVNPASSKEFKDKIKFFISECNKYKTFELDLINGNLFLVSNKAMLKIENLNFKEILLKEAFTSEEIYLSYQRGPAGYIIKRLVWWIGQVIIEGVLWDIFKYEVHKIFDNGKDEVIDSGTYKVPNLDVGPGHDINPNTGQPVYRLLK